jgi:chemotaxis protein methyltransferase CheR
MSTPVIQLSSKDYEFFEVMLKDSSGLDLGKGKEYLLESRLTPLMKKANCATLAEFAEHLRKKPDSRLTKAIADAMTTNESLFFRDGAPFEYFRKTLIPEILKRNEQSRMLRFWSAACSTGQEPLTIAICLLEAGVDPTKWRVEIVGTDFADHALARAKEATYSAFEVKRGLTPEHLTRFFEVTPTGEYKAKPMLRQWMHYRQLNLLEPYPEMGYFDVIFLRNVLIYFEVAKKKEILEKMRKRIAPGGLLFLGATETLLGLSESYERADRTVAAIYRPKAGT